MAKVNSLSFATIYGSDVLFLHNDFRKCLTSQMVGWLMLVVVAEVSAEHVNI